MSVVTKVFMINQNCENNLHRKVLVKQNEKSIDEEVDVKDFDANN